MSKWETAFKNIYGRTPTKRDYTLASTVVKQDLRKRHGIPSPRKKVIRTPVKIRRPRTEEMIKFIKPKRRKLIDSSDSTPLISLLNPKTLSSSDSTDGILANNPLCNKDEIKNILQALTHEPEPVASDKCLYRSPLKPFKLLKSDNFNNIAALLFNSDEDNDCDEEELKTSEEDDLEQWPDETEILTLGKELSKEGQALTAIDKDSKENSKKMVKKKRNTKMPKQNYVRLNLRKKTFVRGYVNANFRRRKYRLERLKRYRK